MTRSFEGIRVFTVNNNRFNRGSAVTIPGIGIFVGRKQVNNTELLRHEFGHILQSQQKGVYYYWIRIAPVSLWSAIKTILSKKHIHMHTWTEWQANKLSYDYFKQPATWDFKKFPVKGV
jgi:hypothetical protein